MAKYDQLPLNFPGQLVTQARNKTTAATEQPHFKSQHHAAQLSGIPNWALQVTNMLCRLGGEPKVMMSSAPTSTGDEQT